MSLPALRVDLVLRLPVMISAHEACLPRWFVGARRFLGPRKLLVRSVEWHFSIGWETHLAVTRQAGPSTWRRPQGIKTLAGPTLSNPAMIGHLPTHEDGGLSTPSGTRPTKHSRNHHRSHSHSLRRIGNRGSRNHGSLGRNRRSRAKLPVRHPLLLCSPCRTHKTSPN